MGVHGKHEDYGSYQYLKGPRDFREFDLVEGEGLFPSYLLPLSSEKEKRVQDLAKRTIIISLHEHPYLFPKDIRILPQEPALPERTVPDPPARLMAGVAAQRSAPQASAAPTPQWFKSR